MVKVRAMSRIGVLTGGGDCPGLNAVIRAVVRKGIKVHGHDFVGFRYGWAGVLAGDSAPLTYENTRGILHRGGTILGTSRTNPYKEEGGLEKLKAVLSEQGVDALIPIGGEDTLGVARRLMDDGVNVVGVPKTIDNDLAGTDFTFGFQTAVQDAARVLVGEGGGVARQHAGPAVAVADEVVAVHLDPLAHDCADDRVEAWAVAAARQYTDP